MLTISESSWPEFIEQLPQLHLDYIAMNPDARPLEAKIQTIAERDGYLGKDLIREIVVWGGNPHNIAERMWRANSEDGVRQVTAAAMEVLDDPEAALGHIKGVHGLGDSFGTKILAMICPQVHAIWDRVVRNALSRTLNPPSCYGDFLAALRQTVLQISTPNPTRPESTWLVRDVEAGLFQFGWPKHRGGNGGMIVGNLPNR